VKDYSHRDSDDSPTNHRGYFLPFSSDEQYMRRVLQLAQRGRGRVSPNPRVGTLVVAPDGRILAEGSHQQYGSQHAEVAALHTIDSGEARGGTLYVNLEPCCHHHKTPPCTQAIIDAGIKRVVAAIKDPYPLVNGGGFRSLVRAGIEVSVGVLSSEAGYLNRGFLSHVSRGRAWCAAKIALSLDGKMADRDGQSKWISGESARKLAHQMRADHDAVLVGAGTVRLDDPELTVRTVSGPNPVRIIIAPNSELPLTSKIAQSSSAVRTILVIGDGPHAPIPPGIESLRIPLVDGQISPSVLLERLPALGITSVLIEGGAGVLSRFLKAGVLDEISIAYAPSVIGMGLSPFDSFIPESWENRPRYRVTRLKRYGEEVVITYSSSLGDAFLPE